MIRLRWGRQHGTKLKVLRQLTPREWEILQGLGSLLPDSAIKLDIHEVARPGGPAETLRFYLNGKFIVELERERIAWPPESAERLVEALAAKLELLGLTGETEEDN